MNTAFNQQRFPTTIQSTGAASDLKVRVEVLEIAISRLSEHVNDVAEKHTETQNIDTILSEMKDQIKALEYASGVSTMSVRGRITEDTVLYKNVTGDYKKDIIKGRKVKKTSKNAPIVIEADTVVRLIYPQETMSPDGSEVVMGCVTIDPDTMALETGWMVICDDTDTKYVGDFQV